MTDELPGALQAAINVEKQVWPHTMDAEVWAEKFCEHVDFEAPRPDRDTMRAWFANAIMAGYDTAQSRAAKPRPWLRAEEVREPGWYWLRGAINTTRKMPQAVFVLRAGDGRFFISGWGGFVADYRGLWQRIPEPELPEEKP